MLKCLKQNLDVHIAELNLSRKVIIRKSERLITAEKAEEKDAGHISAVGERDDLSDLLPL